jgi:GTP-binding protein
LKVLRAEFVTSAADVAGAPRDPAPRVALVGRSNVGKSSLINALAGRRIARTSATPGKTRLANFYRVTLPGPGPKALWLVDLPGYGYARGGAAAAREFARIAESFFGSQAEKGTVTFSPETPREKGTVPFSALLVVDARHPGLAADREAGAWLGARGVAYGVVATKIDKLSRAARARHIGDMTTAFDGPVLPFSAATGEGRDDLWTLIAELTAPPPALK